MARTHRSSTTVALIVCLVGTQLGGTLAASELEPSTEAALSARLQANNMSEANAAISAGLAAALREQPAAPTEPWFGPRSITERSRFTLNVERPTANALLGVASTPFWGSTLKLAPIEPSLFAQRDGYRGRWRRGHNGAAQAAIILGAVATITGAALLVYANRPGCDTNQTASGCGYGTKVAGGAVLSAGIVGIVAGAVTWR